MDFTFTVGDRLWLHSGRLANIRLGLKCQTVTNVQVDSKKAFDSNCTLIWFFCKNPITFQRYLPPSGWPEGAFLLLIGLLLKDHFDFLKRWSDLIMTTFWATFYVRIFLHFHLNYHLQSIPTYFRVSNAVRCRCFGLLN